MEYLCSDCPRHCGAHRVPGLPAGFCSCPSLPVVSRAAPHFGEEPCITGTRGSGAVFFSGCNLRCVFCQNQEISRGSLLGRELSVSALKDVFLRLRDTGVHNLNLVTPTHFVRPIAQALEGLELGIPVVWNSSGYESPETLRRLEGLVQVYMPDMKYSVASLAARYSAAPDYPQAASAALLEMYRQTGPYRLDEDGLLRQGLLIRHLILPELPENTMGVIDWVADSFPKNSVLFSLMSQFTPMADPVCFPELNAVIDPTLAQHMYRYMLRCGIENGYWQDPSSATKELLPDFDLTGVCPNSSSFSN